MCPATPLGSEVKAILSSSQANCELMQHILPCVPRLLFPMMFREVGPTVFLCTVVLESQVGGAGEVEQVWGLII